MASLIPGYEYDIFISYRQKDNKHDGWVTEFVDNLKGELESTFKEEISVYFDINPHDGLLETHDVDASLKDKLKCLVFIPVISRTYCDPKSFAWENEFMAFVSQASQDQFGLKVKLPNGNVASRVLPVRIHDLDAADVKLCESVLGGVLRGVEFIYMSAGVNRPLRLKEDNPQENLNHTYYRDQINKVANAIKEIITAMRQNGPRVEGIQEEVVKPSTFIGKSNRKKIIAGSLILLASIIAGYFIYSNLLKPPEQIEKSIAVLPFINDSPDAGEENTPFVNGLMEEILINLQTIKEFRVPGRTSVEQYRNVFDKSISEKARELDVNYIVEGSVQKYGDRFRLRVQLIRAKGKEAHLWAKSYEQDIKETKDIFSIQSRIAQAIAAELKTVISPEEIQIIEKAPTNNMLAYALYQKGREEFIKYSIDNRKETSLEQAEEFYREALKYDTAYAEAINGLAMIYWARHYWEEYFSKHFMDSVLFLADKALSYDDKLAEAYLLKGDFYTANGDYDLAIDHYEEALSINSNFWQAYASEGNLYFVYIRDFLKGLECQNKAVKLSHDKETSPALIGLGNGYDHLGFFDKAIYYYNEALKLNNDSAGYFNNLAFLENRRQNYLKAIEYAKHSYTLDSSSINNLKSCGDFYLNLGQKDIAISYYLKYLSKLDSPKDVWIQEAHRVGYYYWLTGNPGEANMYFDLQKKYCEEAIELKRQYASNAFAYYDLAGVYSFRGDKEKAYKFLHQYINNVGEDEMLTMVNFLKKHDPLFENIRNEPEFQSILHEVETKYNNTHEKVRKWLEEQGEL
jgi:TolB-like protein/lipopolysaccharide biosynthesis regulator YciM